MRNKSFYLKYIFSIHYYFYRWFTIKIKMWHIKNNKIKSCTIVLILCAINLSSFGSCSPVANEFDSSSQKRIPDDFIMDSVIPSDFSSGEARIFGNFSFGNSSILTVAGFVIVGIILFGKIRDLWNLNMFILYFNLDFTKYSSIIQSIVNNLQYAMKFLKTIKVNFVLF